MRYQPSLQTARLRLRPFVADDASTVSQLAGTREIALRTTSIPLPYSLTAAKTWIAGLPHLYRTGAAVHFALSLLETKELIGSITLRRIDEKNGNAELEIWVGVPWQRQGYGSEALQEVLKFAYEKLNLHRLYSYHVANLQASDAFMQKLGFVQEGVLRDALCKEGEFLDISLSARLADLAEEW